MPTAGVTLNTVLLAYQPSRIIVKTPEGSFDVMEEGNWQGSSLEYGYQVTMEWGVGLSLMEVLAELRTRRGGLDEVRVQFTDMNGVAFDKTMLWEKDPDFTFPPGWGAYETISVTWRDLG